MIKQPYDIYPGRIKTYAYARLSTIVHSSFIYNNLKLETTELSFNS